jgi:hypothetical protein
VNDAGSLQNLNDIVLPGAVPWWPPASGWYVVAALLAMAVAVLFVRFRNNRNRNRYRRQALAELAVIRHSQTGDSLQRLPGLLKRAALAAWPRPQVAALSGAAWHRFLDESAETDRFVNGAGATLDRLAYRVNTVPTPSGEELEQVLDAAEFWLKNHVFQQQGG